MAARTVDLGSRMNQPVNVAPVPRGSQASIFDTTSHGNDDFDLDDLLRQTAALSGPQRAPAPPRAPASQQAPAPLLPPVQAVVPPPAPAAVFAPAPPVPAPAPAFASAPVGISDADRIAQLEAQLKIAQLEAQLRELQAKNAATLAALSTSSSAAPTPAQHVYAQQTPAPAAGYMEQAPRRPSVLEPSTKPVDTLPRPPLDEAPRRSSVLDPNTKPIDTLPRPPQEIASAPAPRRTSVLDYNTKPAYDPPTPPADSEEQYGFDPEPANVPVTRAAITDDFEPEEAFVPTSGRPISTAGDDPLHLLRDTTLGRNIAMPTGATLSKGFSMPKVDPSNQRVMMMPVANDARPDPNYVQPPPAHITAKQQRINPDGKPVADLDYVEITGEATQNMDEMAEMLRQAIEQAVAQRKRAPSKAIGRSRKSLKFVPLFSADQYATEEDISTLARRNSRARRTDVLCRDCERGPRSFLSVARSKHEACLEALKTKYSSSNRTKDSPYAEAIDPIGGTALHYAARSNNIPMLLWLIQLKFNLQVKAANGATAVHDAAASGSVEALQCLLQANPAASTIPLPENDYLPIHLAAMFNQDLVLQYLLENGFNKAVDSTASLDTPLHLAAERGSAAAVEILLNFLEPWDLDRHNDRRMTPLHVAAEHGQSEVMKLFLEGGFDPFTPAASEGALTAIHFAAANGHTAAVQFLLNFEPTLFFSKTNDGATACHLAAARGHVDTLGFLLDQRRNYNPKHIDACWCDEFGATPVHDASATGQLESLKVLADRGVALHTIDKDERTPADMARELGFTECAIFLTLRD
eukprot:m.780640 g.780640  ORF g.780640 m.780640 type:complete len:808 (+) comp59138_c0_seq1:306-2729(+)